MMPRESDEDGEIWPKTPDAAREQTNFQIEQAPPPYLQFAYGILCFIQVSILVYRILLPDCMHHMSPSWITPASLSVVFFIARRESLVTDVGKNVIGLFLLHSTGSLVIALYEHLCSREGIWEGKLRHIMIVLQASCVICGISAVRSMLGLPFLVDLSK